MSSWKTCDTPMGPFTAVVADGAVLASGWTVSGPYLPDRAHRHPPADSEAVPKVPHAG